MDTQLELILTDLDPSSELAVIRDGLKRVDTLLADVCGASSSSSPSPSPASSPGLVASELATASSPGTSPGLAAPVDNDNDFGDPDIAYSRDDDIVETSADVRQNNTPTPNHEPSQQHRQVQSNQQVRNGQQQKHARRISRDQRENKTNDETQVLASSQLRPTELGTELNMGKSGYPGSNNNGLNNISTSNIASNHTGKSPCTSQKILTKNSKYILFWSLQNNISYNLASRLVLVLRHLITEYRKVMLQLLEYDNALGLCEIKNEREVGITNVQQGSSVDHGNSIQQDSKNHNISAVETNRTASTDSTYSNTINTFDTNSTRSSSIGGTGQTRRSNPNNLFTTDNLKLNSSFYNNDGDSVGFNHNDINNSLNLSNYESLMNDIGDQSFASTNSSSSNSSQSSTSHYNNSKINNTDKSNNNNNNGSSYNTNSHRHFKKYPLRYIKSNEDELSHKYGKLQPLNSSVYSTNSDDEREEEEALSASNATSAVSAISDISSIGAIGGNTSTIAAEMSANSFIHTQLEALQEYPDEIESEDEPKGDDKEEEKEENEGEKDQELEQRQELENLLNLMDQAFQHLLQLETAVYQALDLLQGVMLLHSPSRSLCASKSTMQFLLELVHFDRQVASQISAGNRKASGSGFPDSLNQTSNSQLDCAKTSESMNFSDKVNMARRCSNPGLTPKLPNPSSSSLPTPPNTLTSFPTSEQDLVIMYPPSLQIAGINTLVSAMVKNPKSIRMFESCNGVETMCKLFKPKETPKNVKLRILEFLFFYLIPETKGVGSNDENVSNSNNNNNDNNNHHRRANRSNMNNSNRPCSSDDQTSNIDRLTQRKTTKEKSKPLRKYLGNVDGLIAELETSKPFGDLTNIEW